MIFNPVWVVKAILSFTPGFTGGYLNLSPSGYSTAVRLMKN